MSGIAKGEFLDFLVVILIICDTPPASQTEWQPKRIQIQIQVAKTLSPSMDICVSSNFERFLYWLHDGDAVKMNALMSDFARTGKLSVAKGGALHQKARAEMLSARADREETLELMREYQVSSARTIL